MFISNLQSDNNVLLNDTIVSSQTAIPHGGIITVGNCRFRIDYSTEELQKEVSKQFNKVYITLHS